MKWRKPHACLLSGTTQYATDPANPQFSRRSYGLLHGARRFSIAIKYLPWFPHPLVDHKLDNVTLDTTYQCEMQGASEL